MKVKYVLVPVVLLTVLVGCQNQDHPPVPDDLVGMWKTSAKEYSDRFFKLSKDSISFGIGDGNTELYVIKKIKKTYEKGLILYTLYYEDSDGDSYELSFYYDQTEGVIRLKNQKEMAWIRSDQK